MENYLVYLNNVTQLRDTIIHKSGIKFVEGLKIWARWLITHISLFDPLNRIAVLPLKEEYDYQFIHEYMSHGCPGETVHDLYAELHVARAALLATLDLTEAPTFGAGDNIQVQVQTNGTAGVVLQQGVYRQSLGNTLYQKLSREYNRAQKGAPAERDKYIWLILTLYQILDGHSLQWAVPPAVMWVFREKLNCTTDIFASPMNTYNSNYYSLFYHDTYFGSRGNFFTAPDTDFDRGAFHINPPFIISLFTKTTHRILDLLARAERAKQDLTFVYIMPDWNYFDAYNTIYMNRFGKKHIYIPPGQSYYHQYRTDTYILSSFGTHVFVLSTCYDTCPVDLESEICKHFKAPVGKVN